MYEYWQMLAVAYKNEEIDDFNLARMVYIGVNNPKELRKWKFNDVDTTTKVRGNPTDTLVRMAQMFSGGQELPSNGSQIEWAKATGRRIIYIIGENQFVDENGNPTERVKGQDVVLQLPPSPMVN